MYVDWQQIQLFNINTNTGNLTMLYKSNLNRLLTGVFISLFFVFKVAAIDNLTVSAKNISDEYAVSSYGGTQQDIDTNKVINVNDASLTIEGNRWQKISLPYTITPYTIIEFDFNSSIQGEIHGLGFDIDTEISEDRSFQLYGTQAFGLSAFATYSGNDIAHFTIPVGQYYQGNFTYLFFINDDDRNSTAISTYSNIKIYEGTEDGKLLVSKAGVTSKYSLASYGGGQDVTSSGRVEVQGEGLNLNLEGSRWQKIDFSYSVTENTILEFDFQSTIEGEIHGIGFDQDTSISADNSFKLYGTQSWGISDFNTYSGNGITHFTIPVGETYTGDFDYLFFINDDDNNKAAKSTFSNITVYEKPTPIAEYHLDESEWSGTNGEVSDETGNFNATAHGYVSTSNTNPAILGNPGTCRYGDFDGDDDYIELPSDFNDLSGSFTITAWINPSNLNSGSRIFIDDQTNSNGGYGFSLGDPGNGKLRFYSRNVNPISVDTTAGLTANKWYFVSAVHNSETKTRQIYVNGEAQIVTGGNTSNTYTGTWKSDTSGPATIGGEPINGEIRNRFTGLIDEVQIYDEALTTSQIQSIYQETHSCHSDTTSTIDHFEIIHDSNGLTCDVENVSIKACLNSDCSALSDKEVNIDLLGNNTLLASTTFTGSDTLSFNHTIAETLTLSVDNETVSADNPFQCSTGSTSSCDITFMNAGFRFLYGTSNATTIANQTAGNTFPEPLKIQAVKDTDGVCTGLFNGSVNIDLSQENSAPSGTNGLFFEVNGQNIAKYPNSTDTTLSFNSEGIATLPASIYNDAGQIILHANYNQDGVELAGDSNHFWVSPAYLAISTKNAGNENINGNSANTNTTHKAGEDFTLSVTAYNNQDNITQNYVPTNLQFKLSRTAPLYTESVDGTFTYAQNHSLTTTTSADFNDITLTDFSNGTSEYNAAQYSEVGLINLDLQDNNYGGEGILISADDINIGRFTPAYFEITTTTDGSLSDGGQSNDIPFVYTGQMSTVTSSLGQISYGTKPQLTLTAKSQQDITTQNYTRDYMKLQASSVTRVAPTKDASTFGVDQLTKLNVTANLNTLTIDELDGQGIIRYQFNDTDNYVYTRESNAFIAPFSADIDLQINSIVDDDGITTNDLDSNLDNGIVTLSPTGIIIRFGRWNIENSYGPETADLRIPMLLEYWNGSQFVTNNNDSFTDFNASNATLTYGSLTTPVNLSGSGTFIAGISNIVTLSSPGTGNQGNLTLTMSVPTWLQYDWDNEGLLTDDPQALITFGLYRNNDRIIYRGEVFE